MEERIDIGPDDIAQAAASLGIDLSHPEKVAVLQEIESCDIQAGPGSGKTTLLTAKLAILANKWRSTGRGICVLSHTNVARREIEARLSQSPNLCTLLNYPHFIGTFQSFVDQFISIPYLRYREIEVTGIDDDRFEQRAWQMSRQNEFQGLRAWLENRMKDQPERQRGLIGSLYYSNSNLDVEAGRQFGSLPGPETKTRKALLRIKSTLAKDGYFRFEDMFAIAEVALNKFPATAISLRRRFPWIFVDELQDTSPVQDRLVELLFNCPECVLQRLGDKNQAIFDFSESSVSSPELFDRRKSLPLSSTHRFGKHIASIASGLTAKVPQTLSGNHQKADRSNTVFVYKREAVAQVIPRFGDLAIRELGPDRCGGGIIKAVAARKNEGNHKKDNFPSSLRDYWGSYISEAASKPSAPDSLAGYVREGVKQARISGIGGDYSVRAMGGITALVRYHGVARVEKGGPRTKPELHRWLLDNGLWPQVQGLTWSLFHASQCNGVGWNEVVEALEKLFAGILTQPLSKNCKKFLEWSDVTSSSASGHTSQEVHHNVYMHQVDGVDVPIVVDSVHAVKGETHLATLVLESFMKEHDLKAMLPVLTNVVPAQSLVGKEIGHCMRLFVAATRPSELLCLGIHETHITKTDITKLQENGWKIEYVG